MFEIPDPINPDVAAWALAIAIFLTGSVFGAAITYIIMR